MPKQLVATKGLTKEYGSIKALDHLTLTVPPGITGLLGPNGAGKTTLISLLLGLQKPTAGKLTVLGYSPRTNPLFIKERIGWAPEQDYFMIPLPADEFLLQMAELHGIPRITAVKRLSQLKTIFGIGEDIHRKLNTLSSGLKQKVKLIGALLHDPPFLILDEPLKGLDPPTQDVVLHLIKKMRDELGKDILLATHLVEVAEITDNLILLKEGRKVFSGQTGKVLKSRRGVRLKVGSSSQEARSFASFLREKGFNVEYEAETRYLDVTFRGGEAQAKRKILKYLANRNLQLQAFLPRTVELEKRLVSLLQEESKSEC